MTSCFSKLVEGLWRGPKGSRGKERMN
jgi:hypothetical protein